MKIFTQIKVFIFLSLFTMSSGWSQEAKRIPNFQQVTEQIFRGGRPENNDLALLQRTRGIHTIINLENNQQAVKSEQQTAARLGIEFLSEPMSWEIPPSDQQVNQILAALRDTGNFPVFVHCTHGEDRTGLILGLYRVEVEGWSPEKAYKEMLILGFHSEFKALDNYFRERTNYHGLQFTGTDSLIF